MKTKIYIIIMLSITHILFAEGRQIIGSGAFTMLPGRSIEERRVMNQDIARSKPGDYFWRKIKAGQNGTVQYTDPRTGDKWGWLYMVQGDITWARDHNFMAGFTAKLPDVDDSGEKFMEYKKTETYGRKLYDKGTVEDLITRNTEFDKAFADFKQKYKNPIPRKNSTIAGAKQWFYLDKVPDDFPREFWASIKLEGRVMRVLIANGPGHRIALSYWAQDEYMREFPYAAWSWAGVDEKHAGGAKIIHEDISVTSDYFEY